MAIRHPSALWVAGFDPVEVEPVPADGIRDDIYVEDENGELVPYDGIQYVKDANGELVPYVPPPPRQFTEEDRKRANKNRERYTRAAWGKKLRAIAEGRVTVTKEQFQAHLAYGRFRGWNRP
jgi:hypothetical protein